LLGEAAAVFDYELDQPLNCRPAADFTSILWHGVARAVRRATV
jgi:hypothetical protein